MIKKSLYLSLLLSFVMITSVGYSHHTLDHSPEGDETTARAVAEHLQEISVTVHATPTGRYSRGSTEGSGVVVTREDENGEMINFVWTAAHVVDILRKTRKTVDPNTGQTITVIEFDDPTIVTEVRERGRKVGQLTFDAIVIKYSHPEHGHDLALLEIRKRSLINVSAHFNLSDDPLPIGTNLYHVGSLHGQVGSNSMTTGIVSQVGRVFFNKVFDQTTVTAFPGSSGGGVYTQDGKYIGMLTRGAGETFNLVVPTRRMKKFAEREGVLWALDPSVPLPSKEKRSRILVESSSNNSPHRGSTIEDDEKIIERLESGDFFIRFERMEKNK